MDETKQPGPLPPAEVRRFCRLAATELLLPQVACRRRRCRRNRACLGRVAPMRFRDDGALLELPLCAAAAALDRFSLFCETVSHMIARSARGEDAGRVPDPARHGPDDRPWHQPPIRIEFADRPVVTQRRRLRRFRRPPA